MRISPRACLCIVLALPGATSLRAQSFGWHLLSFASTPGARTSVAMAADAAHQQLVMFGGEGPSGLLADTWLWDGAAWHAVQPSPGPSARVEHAMAYDAARQRVVLFGGAANGTAFGDVWEWDGAAWTQAIAASGPSPRAAHALAYDAARQKVVLFGGASAGAFLADTWEWDGASWLLRTPATSPPARAQHAMAYDSLRQRVVMSGGNFGSTTLADVWEWDGATWHPAAPLPTLAGMAPGRMGHAMCWHPPTQQVVLAGGLGISSGTGFVDLADTWAWNGIAWTSMPYSGPVFDHAMAFDPAASCVVLYGGRRVQTWLSLALMWIGGAQVASATPYGTGCGTPPLTLMTAANAQPALGTIARATVTNAPTPLVAIAFGTTNQGSASLPLPLSLSFLGMAGCWLWHSADITSLVATAAGTGYEVALAIPPSTGLLGSHLHLQAWGSAPGANAAGITTSNGMDWVFGSY